EQDQKLPRKARLSIVSQTLKRTLRLVRNPSMPDDDTDKPLNRRSFFRDGLFDLLKPLAKPIERKLAPLERITEEFRRLEEGYAPSSPPPRATPQASYGPAIPLPVLRPP